MPEQQEALPLNTLEDARKRLTQIFRTRRLATPALDALSRLAGLEFLSIDDSAGTGLRDLRPLADFSELRVLSLAGNAIVDVAPWKQPGAGVVPQHPNKDGTAAALSVGEVCDVRAFEHRRHVLQVLTDPFRLRRRRTSAARITYDRVDRPVFMRGPGKRRP